MSGHCNGPRTGLGRDGQGPSGAAIGLDEAGRGCLAGPVVAAAVVFPEGFRVAARLPGLTDSKKLAPARRDELAALTRAHALAWGLGVVWPPEIDRINILQASLKAMGKALACRAFVGLRAGRLAIDGNQRIPAAYVPPAWRTAAQEAVVGGDALVAEISAASVLAKTFRDKLMAALDRRHPGYGFAAHKGYAAAVHREAIRRLGPCRQHRLTFRGVAPETREESLCLPGL